MGGKFTKKLKWLINLGIYEFIKTCLSMLKGLKWIGFLKIIMGGNMVLMRNVEKCYFNTLW